MTTTTDTTWCRACKGTGEFDTGEESYTCGVCDGAGGHPVDFVYGVTGTADVPPVHYPEVAARRYDDPAVSDQQLLQRAWDLRLRDSLSRTTDDSKARMAATGSPDSDWAPLTAAEHLERLQVERWLERRMTLGRPCQMRHARESGASWADIAAALQMDIVELRDQYAAWIDGQQHLHDSIGIGLDDEQAAAAWALLEDGDL